MLTFDIYCFQSIMTNKTVNSTHFTITIKLKLYFPTHAILIRNHLTWTTFAIFDFSFFYNVFFKFYTLNDIACGGNALVLHICSIKCFFSSKYSTLFLRLVQTTIKYWQFNLALALSVFIAKWHNIFNMHWPRPMTC